MRLNIKTTQCCAACEFWDDVGRTAMSPTIGRNMWEVNKKEQVMFAKTYSEDGFGKVSRI